MMVTFFSFAFILPLGFERGNREPHSRQEFSNYNELENSFTAPCHLSLATISEYSPTTSPKAEVSFVFASRS